MNDQIPSWLAGGGAAALLLVVLYLGRLLLEFWRTRKTLPGETVAINVKNAETTNAIILGSLRAIGEDNSQLRAEIAALRTEKLALESRVEDLGRRLAVAQLQIEQISKDLTDLQALTR